MLKNSPGALTGVFGTIEPVAEEPIVEEPIVEEPIVEEPIAGEPIAEELMAEEPIVEAVVGTIGPVVARQLVAIVGSAAGSIGPVGGVLEGIVGVVELLLPSSVRVVNACRIRVCM